MIGGVATLLSCQLAGELTARFLHLPVPGPVIGLALLFGWLLRRHGPEGQAPAALERTSAALLGNLGLLFVPAAVGVVAFLPTLAQNGLPIAAAILIGTALGLVATGLIAQALLRGRG